MLELLWNPKGEIVVVIVGEGLPGGGGWVVWESMPHREGVVLVVVVAVS